MIIVKNKRCSLEKLRTDYPGCHIIDVTSKGEGQWQKLSPFYPHGGIPVPFSGELTSMSVEGVWQGLKVFKDSDVDINSFRNGTMKNIKRTYRRFGRCLGHRSGYRGDSLLEYIEARHKIYIPTYYWMLENKCRMQIEKLKELSAQGTVILLDYDTNADVNDPTKPLSHASLICRYIEDTNI